MLNALIISNNIVGLTDYYVSNDLVTYTIAHVSGHFNPDLTPYDVLVVPNGSDHIAMLRIKDKVRAFLDEGKAVICSDGWFTSWVPGNQWVMDNTKRTMDTRYFLKTDAYKLLADVDIDELIYSHGMTGWWACGYIDAAPGADVVVEDTWQRPIVVLDEVSTAGILFLTASGPLADVTHAGEKEVALVKLYRNFMRMLVSRNELISR
ncbi:hypothetical protein [Spirosoma utsteinense]|uniref:DJ-1/PfpI domain-containing protein n=1 Tax=Spirosoma utsteinense TaxID=2585773 RepID=A0ABR6WA34_9BACT|nr:hypothetical protein [Spirosoma utsteinense]MBC3784119.1 hypothetical protein [Spirosoma utsteinense]MBC3792792.1 hypothetical protein [Spirosoma utsteinense]